MEGEKRVFIIYHRTDYDGIFSGNIARKFYDNNDYWIRLQGFNYGDELPDIDKIISTYDEICMVDISFPNDIMLKLRDSGKLFWIDHHIGVIKFSEEYGFSDIPGIRKDGIAACELCWNYFFATIPVPKVISMLSAYDVWNHNLYDWNEEVLPLQYSLKADYGLNINMIWRHWDYILDPDNIEDFINDGQYLLKYLKNTWKSWCSNYSFEVTVAGKYKGICMISPWFGSSQFDSVIDNYDLCVVVNRKGPDYYNVSIYKEEDKIPEFDCSDYASNVYKTGNGHANASGFVLNFEQFQRLVVNQEI